MIRFHNGWYTVVGMLPMVVVAFATDHPWFAVLGAWAYVVGIAEGLTVLDREKR